MRRTYLITIAVGVLLFLFVSAVLARVWSADGAETDAVTALVQAEARGDTTAVVDRLQGCRASIACRSQVAAYVAELRRAGGVSILQMQLSTGFTLSGHLGTARVAWKSPTSLPIVQCVRVRRAGNAFSGLHIELLALSPRITSDADCPARF
jgi:hypothetical protein